MKSLTVTFLHLCLLLETEGFATPLRLRSSSWALTAVDPADDFRASFRTSDTSNETIVIGEDKRTLENIEQPDGDKTVAVAATRTINDRLLAELEEARQREVDGPRSELTEKMRLDLFRTGKTDEERRAAIEEARNLNGVNPLVTGVASILALAVGLVLWQATTSLGVWLATHPVDSDWYVVQRSSAVFRNVAVGLTSLASGFCGVTGLGLALLTGRVAAGIAKGELDPTPVQTEDSNIQLPDVWKLMRGQKQKDLFDS